MAAQAQEGGGSQPVLAALLELLSIGVVLVDREDAVEYANSAARELGIEESGGLSPAVAGQTEATRAHQFEVEQRHHIRRRRPTRRTVVAVVTSVPMPEGRVALFASNATELERLEAVRRDFVANVSHELKTPVGALSLLAEAVEAGADDAVDVRRFAARMRIEATRLSRLVNDLIDLSRIQGAEPVPDMAAVSVDTLVAEAVDRARLAAGNRRIRLVVGGQRGLMVWGDESQLLTALGNLVDNAVTYSPDNTRVGVGTRAVDRDVEITVSDQGIGIPPEFQERIFERFFRVDLARSRSTGGTGLGLSIVKHVIHNHGGTVRVWSSPGGGSTFTIVLPTAVPNGKQEHL